MRHGPAYSAGGAEAQETTKGDIIKLPRAKRMTLRIIRAYGTAAGLNEVLRTKAGPRTASLLRTLPSTTATTKRATAMYHPTGSRRFATIKYKQLVFIGGMLSRNLSHIQAACMT